MMGWIFSVILFITYAFLKDDALLIASSIFAVAGSISLLASNFKKL